MATQVTLQGTISAVSQGSAGNAQFSRLTLQGRISATSQASAGLARLISRLTLQGSISAVSQGSADDAQLVSVSPILHGSIFASSRAQLGTGSYSLSLSGTITASAMLSGVAGPWQPILQGTITAATFAMLADAEIEIPPPPYPPPFATYQVSDYLDRITSEHNQRPKYMATVGMTIDPVVEDQQLVAGLSGLFDLDYCVGEQEDFTGQWIGKSRWVELPAVFFTWDTEGLGWNQANWRGPADASNMLERLDDYHYRLLLYATVIANHWDGSIPAAYEAWDTLFRYEGLQVIIQDYGNMSMLYGLLSVTAPDVVLLSLFVTGQMDLRPEGVELRAYALQPEPGVPFFSWDSASDSVQGWDTGQWGIMLPPGAGYVPGVGTLWDYGLSGGTTRAADQAQTLWDEGSTDWDEAR